MLQDHEIPSPTPLNRDAVRADALFLHEHMLPKLHALVQQMQQEREMFRSERARFQDAADERLKALSLLLQKVTDTEKLIARRFSAFECDMQDLRQKLHHLEDYTTQARKYKDGCLATVKACKRLEKGINHTLEELRDEVGLARSITGERAQEIEDLEEVPDTAA